MFAPSSLDQQLAATWNAAREDVAGSGPQGRIVPAGSVRQGESRGWLAVSLTRDGRAPGDPLDGVDR